MTIYSGFTHWKWWFSIVMLNYQRVNISPSWVQGALPRSQASSMTSISEPSELSSESSLSPDSESCDECSSSWEHVAGLNQQMEMLWGAHGDLMGIHGNIYGDIYGDLSLSIAISTGETDKVRQGRVAQQPIDGYRKDSNSTTRNGGLVLLGSG